MSIGTNIRKLRELRNYTQTYISGKLNISLSGYSKIERNQTEISVKRLQQIAEILETDIITILSFDFEIIFNTEQINVHNQLIYKNQNTGEINLQKLIEQLKSENTFLRQLINSK